MMKELFKPKKRSFGSVSLYAKETVNSGTGTCNNTGAYTCSNKGKTGVCSNTGKGTCTTRKGEDNM